MMMMMMMRDPMRTLPFHIITSESDREYEIGLVPTAKSKTGIQANQMALPEMAQYRLYNLYCVLQRDLQWGSIE